MEMSEHEMQFDPICLEETSNYKQIFGVGIYFTNSAVKEMYKDAGIQEVKSSGFDLMCAEEIKLNPNQRFQLISLGLVIKIPEGFHAILMPRSSTFKNWQILQANGIGLIDESYAGKNDVWKFPAYYMGHAEKVMPAGSRIAQFILQKRVGVATFPFNPEDACRGGFGSTGQ